jgi:hypothetical protein
MVAPLACSAVLTLAFYVVLPQAYCVEYSTGLSGPKLLAAHLGTN